MTTLQQVHVRVNDAATGKPTPCRVRFTDAAGKYYAPFGRLTEFATEMGIDVGGNVLVGDEAFAYIDGTCEIALPLGLVHLAIHKGPEYKPIQTTVALSPGKMALRFELERWINLRAEQWYPGDTRTHFLSPHAALLESGAEDVAVVNLLAWDCLVFGEYARQHRAIPNLLAFSGQHPALEAPGHMVVVNTMNVHEDLGRLLLLNCHRIVFPLRCGGPSDFDNWTLADWCDQCHRKAGLVIGDDFFGHGVGQFYGELLADLILGKIDALEINSGLDNPRVNAELDQPSILGSWYDLLDFGLRVPLVGGSDKDANLFWIGSTRTYARLEAGQPSTYKNWIEAVRAGRTFVSSGPLLTLSANDRDPGGVIELAGSSGTVRVRAEARSWTPLERLEILANNRVVASEAAHGSPSCSVIETDIPFGQSGWLAARCWGPWDDTKECWSAAHTSPVYVEVQGQRPLEQPELTQKLFGYLNRMLDWTDHEGRYETDAQRLRLRKVFEDALQVLHSRTVGPTPPGDAP